MADLLLSRDDYNYIYCNYVYRGEGNANLVISHLKDKVVLRFRKYSKKNALPVDGGYSRVTREVHFAEKVLLKLLGCYINVPEIVHYDYKIIDHIINSIRKLRPSKRLPKSVLESFATKLPDYTVLPSNLYTNLPISLHNNANSTYCVEIKPKQGYVCKLNRTFSKCPFCLKQFYKAKEESNIKITNYCPLDLFSGNKLRMKKAISSLIQNPQNNFKVFKNGKCCYDHESSLSDLYNSLEELFNSNYEELFTNLLIKILLHRFYKEQYLSIKNIIVNDNIHNIKILPRIDPNLSNQLVSLLRESCNNCDDHVDTLPSGCVLERILQMQKLHQHSDDVVYTIYEKYFNIICDNIIHTNVINSFQDENIKNENLMNEKINCSEKEELYSILSPKHKELTPTQNELKILQNYLLFSTAKDCSIMICFKKIDKYDMQTLDTRNVIELSKNHNYIVNVKISDVDLKSIKSIDRHCKRDNDIVNIVITTLREQLK